MNWQFVVQIGNDDYFSPPKEQGREQIIVQLQKNLGEYSIQENIADIVKRFHLSQSEIVRDLLNIAIAIYSADKMIKREEAYDGWTRYITLYIPVSNKNLWEHQKELLLEAVRFLSGDYWEIEFRGIVPMNEKEKIQPELLREEGSKQVVLLSGGLDSFIGAIDTLEETENEVVFLSHYGAGIIKSVQDQVINYLKDQYKERVISIQPYIQPPKPQEPSQRSRSILFLGLGIFVAHSLGRKSKLHVCENGFISLNVPISSKRIGSNSTRTTHPFFIDTVRKLLENLGIDVEIITAYRYKTKGEMLRETQNSKMLLDGLKLTRSCSKSNLRWSRYDPKGHCGICMPCIIRRSALRAAGMPEGDYLYDITSDISNLSTSQTDTIRALRIFLERYKEKEGTLIFDILSNGPLPESAGIIDEFESVFRRGLKEINDLLGQKT